ncbi:hypothetical protein [Paenibacillus agilis]|uniref:Uncharacterized protein n=1 Tax=Paenibacillus agilis TaxID=3020863 RepID=A0A559J1F1_9BACL|nr:hypothetical protein [Paenibacillus agilis]TVX93673.1 hypothetical protein FPZ44_11765 [Paenibacillus agilis]
MNMLYILLILYVPYTVGAIVHLRKRHEKRRLFVFSALSLFGIMYTVAIIADWPMPTPESIDRLLYRPVSNYIRQHVLGL